MYIWIKRIKRSALGDTCWNVRVFAACWVLIPFWFFFRLMESGIWRLPSSMGWSEVLIKMLAVLHKIRFTSANSAFNFRQRSFWRTKSHSILHSRQGPSERHPCIHNYIYTYINNEQYSTWIGFCIGTLSMSNLHNLTPTVHIGSGVDPKETPYPIPSLYPKGGSVKKLWNMQIPLEWISRITGNLHIMND